MCLLAFVNVKTNVSATKAKIVTPRKQRVIFAALIRSVLNLDFIGHKTTRWAESHLGKSLPARLAASELGARRDAFHIFWVAFFGYGPRQNLRSAYKCV